MFRLISIFSPSSIYFVSFRFVSQNRISPISRNMLVSNIVRQLESHHILNNFQHCFRQLNSCETQLIGFINDFAKDVQNGWQTYVIVMDFSRASFCWWCCRKILGWLFNCRKLYRIWKNGRKTGNGIQYCQIKCPKNQRRLEPFIFNYTLHGCCPEAEDTTKYRKIPKISSGAYIFQRPFLRGLFLEGLIFGGAYLRLSLIHIWRCRRRG